MKVHVRLHPVTEVTDPTAVALEIWRMRMTTRLAVGVIGVEVV
jgi:hypothetical protein